MADDSDSNGGFERFLSQERKGDILIGDFATITDRDSITFRTVENFRQINGRLPNSGDLNHRLVLVQTEKGTFEFASGLASSVVRSAQGTPRWARNVSDENSATYPDGTRNDELFKKRAHTWLELESLGLDSEIIFELSHDYSDDKLLNKFLVEDGNTFDSHFYTKVSSFGSISHMIVQPDENVEAHISQWKCSRTRAPTFGGRTSDITIGIDLERTQIPQHELEELWDIHGREHVVVALNHPSAKYPRTDAFCEFATVDGVQKLLPNVGTANGMGPENYLNSIYKTATGLAAVELHRQEQRLIDMEVDPHFDVEDWSRIDRSVHHLSQRRDDDSISDFSGDDETTYSSDGSEDEKISNVGESPNAVKPQLGLLQEQERASDLWAAGTDQIHPSDKYSPNDMLYYSDDELEASSEYSEDEERDFGFDSRGGNPEREPSADLHAATAQLEKRSVSSDVSTRGQKRSATEAGIEQQTDNFAKLSLEGPDKAAPSSDQQGIASEALKKPVYDERSRDRSPER